MRYLRRIMILGLFFTVSFAWQAVAKDQKMGIGLALPPYIMQTDTGAKGMEFEIVKEALSSQGHTIIPKFLPFGKLTSENIFKKLSGVLTTNEASGVKKLHYSKSHVTYQNVAVTLKRKNIKIQKISDLQKGRILAFQNATKYLGAAYKNTVSKNRNYKEMANQDAQVAYLFLGKTDVLVGDINIFKYFRKNTKKTDTSAEVVIHKIFSPVYYKVGFVDAKVRDDFNKGLKILKNSGRYQNIISKYVN